MPVWPSMTASGTPPAATGDDGLAAEPGLDEDETEALGAAAGAIFPGGQDEDLAAAIPAVDLGVGDLADEADRLRHAQRGGEALEMAAEAAVADDHVPQRGHARQDQRECPDHHVVALVGVDEPADRQQMRSPGLGGGGASATRGDSWARAAGWITVMLSGAIPCASTARRLNSLMVITRRAPRRAPARSVRMRGAWIS